MKKNILILPTLMLLTSICAQAQYVNNEENGIHVSGGFSNQSSVSSSIGTNCQARGLNSFAAGSESIALGTNSFALGTNCRSLESNAFSFGDYVHAEKTNSMALGAYVTALGSNCVVIGTGHNYLNPLSCSTPGVAIGVNSTIPTLFVSKANGNYRTGRVVIGNTTAPQTKVHIVADDEEEAGIFLQTLGKTRAFVRLLDEKHELAVDDDGRMHLLSISNPFHLESRNASITDGEITLGNPNDRKLKLMTTDFPAFYANASRSGNSYICYQQGASFAIEFNNNAMLFRTAYTENNTRIMEINGWRDPLCLKTDGSIVMKGKVGINTENNTGEFALAVDGGIISTEVYVMNVENWPDFVFGQEYELMSLSDLKHYINTHHHLPDLPSQQGVRENGFEISDMQAQLLQKIEELTLYILQQEERISQLELELKKDR